MAAAGLQVDLAGMLGDRRVGVQHHALRRVVDALIGRLGRMAHGAAAEHGVAHGREMRRGDERLSAAADAFGSPVSTFGTVDSQMMMMNRIDGASQVQVGLPLRAWMVLK